MNINKQHYLTILILISLILLSFPQTVLSQGARPTGSSGRERLAVVTSVSGTTLSVDFDPITGVAAVDLGKGNVVFVDPGEDTTFDMGASNVVCVEVPDSGAGGGVLLTVVSGDIEVQIPTGDVINMDAGDAVEVGEIGTDGSVEVAVTGGEVTLAIDAGDVTMDVGDVVIVTEGANGVGLEITSGEVTLETGTGDVVMGAGDDVIISVDSESGNAEIGVVGGDGVDMVDVDTGETVTVEVGGGVEVQIVVDEGDNEDQTDFGANVMAEAEAEAGVTDEGVVFTTDFDESDTTASYISDISESSNTYTGPDSDGVGDNWGEYPNYPTEDGDGGSGSSDDDSHEDNGIHRGNDKEDRHKDKGKHKSEGKKKHDFAGLIDNIVDPPVASTDYLLAFAKVIRGDMDTYNEEYPDAAANQSERQAFIEEVDEVISDINTSIIKPGTTDIFDSLMTANQAKTFLNEHINDFGDTTAHNDIRSQIDSVNNNNHIASTIDSINKYKSQELTRRVSSSKRQPHKLVNRNGGAHGILHTTNPGRKVVDQSKHTKKH